jgi:hypothetical protein
MIQQLDMMLGAIVLVAFIAGYAVVSYVIGKVKQRRSAVKLSNESEQSELK